MILKPQDTLFKFILDNEQLFTNLDHLKLNNYDRFLKIGELGKQIQMLAKDDEAVHELQELCENSRMEMPFMKMEVEEAFNTALNLRNEAVVQYFLKNGLAINDVAPEAILSICYSLEYLTYDPPVDLLKICLSYGGNARAANSEESDTPMHLAARYGQIPFLELLIEYGGDINGVNDSRKTPLGCAMDAKRKNVVSFLQQKNAREKWDS